VVVDLCRIQAVLVHISGSLVKQVRDAAGVFCETLNEGVLLTTELIDNSGREMGLLESLLTRYEVGWVNPG
jgi:hypothetical protein